MSERHLVCAFCGQRFDMWKNLVCPVCGGKYICPSQSWRPMQLRLWWGVP